MTMVIDAVIYLLLVFGIIITTIAFLDGSMKKNERYIRVRREGARVKLQLNIEGMSEQDKILIADVIEKGKFESIYDVVDEYTLQN